MPGVPAYARCSRWCSAVLLEDSALPCLNGYIVGVNRETEPVLSTLSSLMQQVHANIDLT